MANVIKILTPAEIKIHRDTLISFARDLDQDMMDKSSGTVRTWNELFFDNSYESMRNDMDDHEDNYIYAVAMIDDEIVGTIQFFDCKCGTRSVQYGHINRLIVAEDVRGKGYGTELIEYVRSRYKKMGVSVLTIGVSACNPSAESLYKSIGFEPAAKTLVMSI